MNNTTEKERKLTIYTTWTFVVLDINDYISTERKMLIENWHKKGMSKSITKDKTQKKTTLTKVQ